MTTETEFTRQIQLKIAELKAVRLFASEDLSRFVLNSVHIEAGKDTALLVATNGAVLATIGAALEVENTNPFTVTIPAHAIDSIARQCSKDAVIDLVVQHDLANDKTTAVLRVGVVRDSAEVHVELIPAIYPDWRAILPMVELQASARVSLSPVMAEKFVKAAKLLNAPGGLCLGMGREGPVQVSMMGRPNFFGLWMPMRPDDEAPGTVPGWVRNAAAVRRPDVEPMAWQLAKWDAMQDVHLWTDEEGRDSKIIVGRWNPEPPGKPSWCAVLLVNVGQESLKQELSLEINEAKRRPDAIRVAGKRLKAWLVQKLGKESAKGFYDKIEEAVESQKEREE